MKNIWLCNKKVQVAFACILIGVFFWSDIACSFESSLRVPLNPKRTQKLLSMLVVTEYGVENKEIEYYEIEGITTRLRLSPCSATEDEKLTELQRKVHEDRKTGIKQEFVSCIDLIEYALELGHIKLAKGWLEHIEKAIEIFFQESKKEDLWYAFKLSIGGFNFDREVADAIKMKDFKTAESKKWWDFLPDAYILTETYRTEIDRQIRLAESYVKLMELRAVGVRDRLESADAHLRLGYIHRMALEDETRATRHFTWAANNLMVEEAAALSPERRKIARSNIEMIIERYGFGDTFKFNMESFLKAVPSLVPEDMVRGIFEGERISHIEFRDAVKTKLLKDLGGTFHPLFKQDGDYVKDPIFFHEAKMEFINNSVWMKIIFAVPGVENGFPVWIRIVAGGEGKVMQPTGRVQLWERYFADVYFGESGQIARDSALSKQMLLKEQNRTMGVGT